MRRIAAACGAIVALVAVGCTPGSHRSAPARAHGSPSPSGPAAVRLPPIELRAYLSERPGRWEAVTTIPFGTDAASLAFEEGRESPTVEPSSFAIARDGTIWILDAGNARVAHYSRAGRFLGAIVGLSLHARDVAFVGDAMCLIDREQGFLAAVTPTGALTRAAFAEGDHVIHLLQLVPDGPRLTAHVDAEPYGSIVGVGTERFGLLETSGAGRVELLPGLPVGDGRWIRITDQGLEDPHELDLEYVSASSAQVQPYVVHLLTGGAPGGRRVPSVSGPVEFASAGAEAYLTIAVAPDRPRDARLEGGRWLLRVGSDASAMLWERLPQAGIDDSEQFRRLAVGPDGHLYLMVLTSSGTEILQRG